MSGVNTDADKPAAAAGSGGGSEDTAGSSRPPPPDPPLAPQNSGSGAGGGEAYAAAVREWMRQYHEWQQMNMFVAWSVMQQQQAYAMQAPLGVVPGAAPAAYYQPQGVPPTPQPGFATGGIPVAQMGAAAAGIGTPGAVPARAAPHAAGAAANSWSAWILNQLENINRRFQPQPVQANLTQRLVAEGALRRGSIYKVAPIYHRIIAESIDFFILFFLKVVLTYVIVEYFDIIDISKYDLELWVEGTKDRDFLSALDFTADILLLETIHRILVCVYETAFTYRGSLGVPGGGTPGKRIMGLKILTCNSSILSLGNSFVLVTPAEDLGLWRAIVRSLIKNFSMAFFFPLVLSMFFTRHNRAVYDIVSGCVVVSVRERFNLPAQQPQQPQPQPRQHEHQE